MNNPRFKFYLTLSIALVGASLILENYQQLAGFEGINLWPVIKFSAGVVMVGVCGPMAYYYASRSKQWPTKEQIETELLAKRQEKLDKLEAEKDKRNPWRH